MSTDYTHEDFNRARLHGSYANAAAIALELSKLPNGQRDAIWFEAHERMAEKATVYDEGYAAAKKDTDRKDINGRDIRAGDRVWLYPQDYESELVGHAGEIPIYEMDTSRPKPVPDVVLLRGTVEWDPDQLQWRVKASWVSPLWGEGIASVCLCHYAAEVQTEEAA